MRNAECGIDRATVEPRSELAGSTSALQFRIPHSALRIRGGAGAVRVVLQRVSRAEVRVNGRVTGKIGVGFLVLDRKSTRLNSSHVASSYAVFCLNKKKATRIL